MYYDVELLAVKESNSDTLLQVKIKNKSIADYIMSHAIRKGSLHISDGRYISPEQRKKIYATIADIANWTGFLPEEAKEWLKYYYVVTTGRKYISFSDCSVEDARVFINVMIDFCIKTGIQITGNIMERSDDIDATLYACIRHRKCCICGRKGDLHHVDAIGMGNNRYHYDDSKNLKMCLCRMHHTEAHTIGREQFQNKYKVYGITFDEGVERAVV